jgi:hypothetical protein
MEKAQRKFLTAPFLFVAGGCGGSRLKFSRLPFPAGRATSRDGRSERVLNEFFANGACCASFGFALQRNVWSDNYTSFRAHFSHNGNFASKATKPRQETKIPPRIAMERNDLGGLT